MPGDFHFRFIKPDKSIADFVESIGMFHNSSDEAKETVLLPDGKIDLILLRSASAPFHITLIGLETRAEKRIIPKQKRPICTIIRFKTQVALHHKIIV